MTTLAERTADAIYTWKLWRHQKRALRQWERDGRPDPPPHLIKQRILRDYAQRYDLEILVETGTYKGEMVQAMRDEFAQIYSIELSHELCAKAQHRFRNASHVHILQGDSGVVLGQLMPKLNRPTLFWLDGHYSAGVTACGDKETPIFEELGHVLNSRLHNFVVVIDDARLFGSDPAYPSVRQLKNFVSSFNLDAAIRVETDSIRIEPHAA